MAANPKSVLLRAPDPDFSDEEPTVPDAFARIPPLERRKKDRRVSPLQGAFYRGPIVIGAALVLFGALVLQPFVYASFVGGMLALVWAYLQEPNAGR